MNIKLDIKKLHDDAVLPKQGTDKSAGYDVYSYLDSDVIELKPGETYMVHTGICLKIPDGYFGGVYPRSGIASKRNLRLANCVGVIDSDYRGELMIPIYNDSNKNQIIENKERIAQLIIQPYLCLNINVVDDFEDDSNRTGGFGSTGTK